MMAADLWLEDKTINREDKTMKTFKDLLDAGITFKPLGASVTPQDIAALEAELRCKLPEQYREYLLYTNGGKLEKHMTDDDNGYYFTIQWPEAFAHLFPDDDDNMFAFFLALDNSQSLNDPAVTTLRYGMVTWPFRPKGTLHIANTAGGADYILLGIGEHNYGKVILWRLVGTNRVESPDVAAIAYETVLADSFVDFVLSLRPVSELL